MRSDARIYAFLKVHSGFPNQHLLVSTYSGYTLIETTNITAEKEFKTGLLYYAENTEIRKVQVRTNENMEGHAKMRLSGICGQRTP